MSIKGGYKQISHNPGKNSRDKTKDRKSESWVLTGLTINENMDAKGRGSDLTSATRIGPIRTRTDLGAMLTLISPESGEKSNPSPFFSPNADMAKTFRDARERPWRGFPVPSGIFSPMPLYAMATENFLDEQGTLSYILLGGGLSPVRQAAAVVFYKDDAVSLFYFGYHFPPFSLVCGYGYF